MSEAEIATLDSRVTYRNRWMTVREDRPDASMDDVARGELQEETGVEMGRVEEVGTLPESYGFADQRRHVFVGRDLQVGPVVLLPEEQGLISRRFTAQAVSDMVADGTIQDMTTVAALGLARLRGAI